MFRSLSRPTLKAAASQQQRLGKAKPSSYAPNPAFKGRGLERFSLATKGKGMSPISARGPPALPSFRPSSSSGSTSAASMVVVDMNKKRKLLQKKKAAQEEAAAVEPKRPQGRPLTTWALVKFEKVSDDDSSPDQWRPIRQFKLPREQKLSRVAHVASTQLSNHVAIQLKAAQEHNKWLAFLKKNPRPETPKAWKKLVYTYRLSKLKERLKGMKCRNHSWNAFQLQFRSVGLNTKEIAEMWRNRRKNHAAEWHAFVKKAQKKGKVSKVAPTPDELRALGKEYRLLKMKKKIKTLKSSKPQVDSNIEWNTFLIENRRTGLTTAQISEKFRLLREQQQQKTKKTRKTRKA